MTQLVGKSVEKRRARDLKTRPQVRKSFPPEAELRALARSVMKRQLHPLIVHKDDVVLDGECRLRGLMLENPDFEVEVIVVDRELSATEICELQMISAMHSTSLSSFDQALACKEWLERNPGATAKELAAKIDRDPSMLTRLGSLWRTIPAVVKAAEEGRIGPRAWYQISLLPEADQAGLLEMHLAGVPAAQIADLRRKQRTSSAAVPSARVNRIKCPLPSGAVVQVTGGELSLADMLDVLAELTKLARKANEDGQDPKAFMAVLKAKTKEKPAAV